MKRSHPIKVRGNNQITQIECYEDENLLDAMRRQGIPYYSDCGGRGSCGKCKIKIINGTTEPGIEDIRRLSEKEGYGLACRAFPKGEMEIELADYEERFNAVISAKNIPTNHSPNRSGEEGYAVAIDLGTTTLAFQLVNCQTEVIMASLSSMNPQRRLGADVISRMKASISVKSRVSFLNFLEMYGDKGTAKEKKSQSRIQSEQRLRSYPGFPPS